MFDRNSQLELIMDLETRHDDLLSRLEELDKRVAKTLAECMATRQPIVVGQQQCAGTGGN